MRQSIFLSYLRIYAVLLKEFQQLIRDRATFAMVFGLPIMQLVFFGLIINEPKNLPTILLTSEKTPIIRSFVAGLQNSGYFSVLPAYFSPQTAQQKLRSGAAQIIIELPPGFTRKILRHEQPQIGLWVDAADPTVVSAAVGHIEPLLQRAVSKFLQFHGSPTLQSSQSLYTLNTHKIYNPAGIMNYNIIPGLIGVILTMTLMMITAVALVREKEVGSMENLLATPVKPFELMLGKLFPYALIAFLQFFVIFFIGTFLFEVPLQGSFLLLLLANLIFVVTNLSLGLTLSTIAKSQVQAFQFSFLLFLPSLMLSGFLFNYYGMPYWAQKLSEILPLTHFIRLMRGIFLKGANLQELAMELLALILLGALALFVALKKFKKTLD